MINRHICIREVGKKNSEEGGAVVELIVYVYYSFSFLFFSHQHPFSSQLEVNACEDELLSHSLYYFFSLRDETYVHGYQSGIMPVINSC